jgi:tetratricopeptide (TPR) repeat protein
MISWVAIERIAERKMATDAAFRKQTVGRPLRSDAKRCRDGELLAKLRSYGIELDRPSLERLCDGALSAEEIAKSLLDQPASETKRDELESDWIWISIAALWQRWFPDKPSFERLDDKMQAGYDLLASTGAVAACRAWLDAWTDVLHIFDKTGTRTIGEFDDRFRGSQSLFNWIQDFEDELWNAGLEDRQFLSARIAVCEEGLRRFHAEEDLMTENRRRALAESYYELGARKEAEALYRGWLHIDPRWGWGWIGWSDCYQFTRTESGDLNRAEQLLREGLAIADVRDRSDIAERLADLCEEQGRNEEAKEFRREVAAIESTLEVHSDGSVLRKKSTITFGDKGLPLSELSNVAARLRAASSQPVIARPKVGRNEPCPCGSGKKFKKCCGASSAV